MRGMFEAPVITAADKPALYRELASQVRGLLHGERNLIANAANFSALVFNTLLSSAPKDLAGDVGAWRGLVHNLSGSVGIAVISAFAVGTLASTLAGSAQAHPEISAQLISEVNINNADFLTNPQLEAVLQGTSATETEKPSSRP